MYPQPPFNPEELNLLYRAYAAALRDIEFSEAGKNDDPPANETCLVVALRIVAAAANVLPIYGTKATLSLPHLANMIRRLSRKYTHPNPKDFCQVYWAVWIIHYFC